MNLLTFFAFGWDKYCAKTEGGRVPEKILWFLIAIGGSLGAIIGIEVWKHKRKKINFVLVVAAILAGQGVVAWWVVEILTR